MATFTAVKCGTQTGGAMNRALNYVKQEKKTMCAEHQLVTGWNCVAQSACDEMMTTKRHFGKTDGMMFYHFVQSFDPKENVTPEEVHAIGLELAQKLFPAYEVLIATHVDADHLHNHLIVNSVSFQTGRKLHQNAADLQRQRQVSDEICRAHGLTILGPPPKRTEKKNMSSREYRSAVKGESWKLRLMSTIDLCMKRAKTRDEFIREMERRDYQVRWEPTRQAITYTTPKGKKCRDNRLHDKKYLKEVMEREFRIREELLIGGVEKSKRITGDYSLAAAGASPDSGRVGNPDERPVRAVPSGGHTAEIAESAGQSPKEPPDTGADGRADGDSGAHPDTDRTGWEKERAEAFTAQAEAAGYRAAATVPVLAVDHSDLGRLVGAVANLGHALERDQSPAPMTPAARHSDRKALRREQERKIALGHKPDDHKDELNNKYIQTM